jgi:hypothetical protein
MQRLTRSSWFLQSAKRGGLCVLLMGGLAASSSNRVDADTITPIFPGPDIPILRWDVEYALGWWTSPGIDNVRLERLYFSSVEDVLSASTSNNGKFLWYVAPGTRQNSDQFIRISDASDTPGSGELSAEFGVNATVPGYQMVFPFNAAANEQAVRGSSFDIQWQLVGAGHSSVVDVELWYLGTRESVLANDAPNTGSFSWAVPASQHLNSDYRIVIVDGGNPRYKAVSTEFSVVESSSIVFGLPRTEYPNLPLGCGIRARLVDHHGHRQPPA